LTIALTCVLLLAPVVAHAQEADRATPPATQPAATATAPAPGLAKSPFAWTRLYTTGNLDLITGKCEYSLQLEGRLTLPDDPSIVQACRLLELTEVVDQDDRSLLAYAGAEPARPRGPAATQPGAREFDLLTVGRRPNSYVPVFLSLKGLPTRPRTLKRLAGNASLLAVVDKVTKDLPAARTDQYVEAVPGLACRVDKWETSRQGLFVCAVDFRKDGLSAAREVFAAPYVSDVALFDAHGPMSLRRNVSSTWLGDQKLGFIGTVTAQFAAPVEKPTGVRLTVVTRMKEIAVPFEMRQVPVE
jgi:hypothetical protein